MDSSLRELERRLAEEPTSANQQAYEQALTRAGYKMVYTPCNACSVRSRGWCTKCGGDGWTGVEWQPPEV